MSRKNQPGTKDGCRPKNNLHPFEWLLDECEVRAPFALFEAGGHTLLPLRDYGRDAGDGFFLLMQIGEDWHSTVMPVDTQHTYTKAEVEEMVFQAKARLQEHAGKANEAKSAIIITG